MIKYNFNYQKEKKQNHFIGFTSFQHFRDEALYSDVVVKPENYFLETENYEGYPIIEGVPQEGRKEGFHPDTSVAYIRVLWKDFEPEKGQYNYALIQDILDKAKAYNQTVMFRLIPHSTNKRDDVPYWLKDIVECPARPDGKRVKDSPTDEIFVFLFLKAVKAFAIKFDSNKTLDVVDISLPSCWGEGHGIENFSDEILHYVNYVNCKYFKNTKLIAQIIRPDLVVRDNEIRPVGWRADGVGFPWLMENTYATHAPKMPKDAWKKAPISFEAFFWISHWKRSGWDIDAIMDWMLDMHMSTFNNKSFPIPYEWEPNIERVLNKMGYHFVIDYCEIDCESKSNHLQINFAIDNVGVAPIYNKIPLRFRVKGDNFVYDYISDVDITTWLPGKTVNQIKIPLPNDIKSGSYELSVAIFDNDFYIYFATDAKLCEQYYKLGNFTL